MKSAVLILVFAFCSVECRKIVQINKNANVDFINMEAGGGGRLPAPPPAKPISPQTPTQPKVPSPVTTPKPAPVSAPATTAKPAVTPPPKPQQPIVPQKPQQPQKPNQGAMDLEWKPLQPVKPGTVTTPGPGSVKSLVNFYDSQGKASVIRPYSYSDAVKKGQ